jgi:hypothetical protein
LNAKGALRGASFAFKVLVHNPAMAELHITTKLVASKERLTTRRDGATFKG